MASSRYSTPPGGFVRVESMRSNASSGHHSRAKSSNFDAMSEIPSFTSESAQFRFQDQLHELAVNAGVPLTLPNPMLSHPSQRAIPQNPSDKEGAEAFLMSLRPKKFLLGKSSKGFLGDEVMLGLDRAIKDQISARIVEALLQLAESAGVTSAISNAVFTSGKKGHAIPTLDYVFSQTEHPRPFEVWQQFLGRVSQRALDISLAGVLKNRPTDVVRIRALLEYGANPELCQDRILDLVSSSDSEDTVETILLSPSITNPEFLNQALIRATPSGSLRNAAMLLLRGADANFNHGSAMKVAVSKRSFNIALALALLSKQPISPSLLDESTGVIGSWSQEDQKPFLTVLLYAGACGPRTSRTISPYIINKDRDIMSFLVDTLAFNHGSFPSSKLFHAAVELKDTALALGVLRSSKYRSFSDYASTGVHLQLVQNYTSNPDESLELIAELLTLGVAGDYSSQMLIKSCEPELVESSGIMALINLLIQSGAKASYLDGKCLLLAIEAGQPAVVRTLVLAQPTKKILNTAISHANSCLRDGDPAKLEIWSILLKAGASGDSVDQQLLNAIDRSPQALEKIRALLPAASLDFSDGEALVKAIHLERFDILETCLEAHRPQSSLPSIWKQTRRLFDIAGSCSYNLLYMQKTLEILHNVSKKATPLDDLLHDATQCRSNEFALSLSSQLLRWGASPNHALGVSLVACIKRSDSKTLAALLSQNPSKTSLKYGFEEALELSTAERYEILKMIVEAGVEKASLDAALPRILKEVKYEPATVHLLVSNGARLHSALAENLIPPVKNLDIPVIETLIPKTGQKENLTLPLKALLELHQDWQAPDGKSLPMVKLLLANSSKGTWCDQVFIAKVKELNQHAASLFIGHVTSRQILSDAMYELLRQDKKSLSREKLSMTIYLLNQGAKHDIVDGIFLQSAQTLNYEWVTTLNPYLLNPAVRLSAFEAVTLQNVSTLGGNRLEIVQFLLQNGVKGSLVDAVFVKSAAAGDLENMSYFLSFVSSKDTSSQALSALIANKELASTNNGRAVIKILLQNGASGSSVLNSAAAAAKADNLDGVKLIVGDSKQASVNRAAFEGLIATKKPLSTPESLSILSYLVENGLDSESAMTVARTAASRYDIPLMKSLAPIDKSGQIYDAALKTIAGSSGEWLSSDGLFFVEYLITRGATGSNIQKMIDTAARSKLALRALRILLPACGDRQLAANLAFASFACDKHTSFSTEKLPVIDFLLTEGASGKAVEELAALAAEQSNYDVLDIFLKSAIAGSVIPAAFKSVARNKSKHLSSDQLSIASILVKHGVSTEVLAIASVEATKLLDLEALRVLSTSERYPNVIDETLRALFLTEQLWRSPGGLAIMQFLFEMGVSLPMTETAASKATLALDVDILRVVLDYQQSYEIVDVAFSSMTGLEKKWLSPEGLRIAELLVTMNPSQANIDKAFIQACQYLHYDAVQLLHQYVIDVSVFNTALAKATSAEAGWLTEMRVIERLLDSGVEGEAIESALVKGAQALNYESLQLLSPRVDRWEVYSEALATAQTNKNWRQSLKSIEFLLHHGANGEPVDTAFISAARNLDFRATALLAGHVDNQNADCEAFTAATTNDSWLLPNHQDLLSLLYHRGVSADIVKPALIAAAGALSAPAVELLAQNANNGATSAAFASAMAKGNDWTADEGISVLRILVQKGAQGVSVEQALINSAQLLRLDIVNILVPYIDKENVQCFSSAFDAVVANRDMWLSRPEALNIVQILIEYGASTQSAHTAIVDAAESGNYDAVNILSQIVDDPAVYTEAFDMLTQTESLWLLDESQELLQGLLSRGACGEPLDISLVNAVQEVVHGVASDTLVSLLLEHGADVNFDNGRALQFAARDGRLDLFDLLLHYAPNAITLYMSMREALCSSHGEELALDFLIAIISNDSLEVETDVNYGSSLGWPLIFYSLRNYPSSAQLAQVLCDCNADLTITMSWAIYEGEDEPSFPPVPVDEITPLLFAIEQDASDDVILNVLLAYGAKAKHDYVPRHSQATALILAARKDRTLVLSNLLDLGARVDQIDCFDHSPLFYASRNGNLPAITSLLKKNPPTDDGSLHEAARELHADAVKMLVAAGHLINYPSLKHGGRSPLCELCYRCEAATNPVGLQNTLSTIIAAKATPMRKYRGMTPIFFAMENANPVTVVLKLIAASFWEDLNNPENVIEKDSHFYSPTMYIKKGLCNQTESNALGVLRVLQDASAEDRFYAKERMRQPEDAIGMPQRIADLDRKKWMRSSKLEEEQEDHQRKLRREKEEMDHRDNLNTQRHLLTMEHADDLSLQTIRNTASTRWQDLQFKSIEHSQSSRYKDDNLIHRLDDTAGHHTIKFRTEHQLRETQLQHESQATQQKLGYLGQEQNLRLEGAQAQQQLKLDGMSTETTLKGEALNQDLYFKEARGNIDRADMDYRLQHTTDMSSERISTQGRLEDIARDSQRRKNVLDQESRQSQLGFQSASEDRKLMTENTMNQYRRSNNDDTVRTRDSLSQIETRTMQDKHQMQEHDRQNQMRFNVAADRQRLGTLAETGRITNDSLYNKGRIENDSLRGKNELLHENRNNELQHTADMGYQRTENERSLGQQKYYNEQNMGQVRVTNEQNMGKQKVTNENNMGYAKANSERIIGQQKVRNEHNMGNAKAHSERVVGQQKVRNEHNMGNAKAHSERVVGQQKVRNEHNIGSAKANSERLVGTQKARTAQNVNSINNRGAAYRESLKHGKR